MNSQNMTIKSLRISLLATMAMILSFGFSMANGPTGTDKAGDRLRVQVQELVEAPGMDADLSGKAVITFKVDANDRIEVVKVISSNPALTDHIEASLEGKRVDDYNLDANQRIRFNLTFNDQRKTMRF